MSFTLKIKEKVEQVKNLLYSFRHMWEFLPFVLMIVHTVIYIKIVSVIWIMINKGVPITQENIQANCAEWFLVIYDFSSHYFDVSVILWLVLYSLSKSWRKTAKISLRFLFFYLVLNSVMLVNNYFGILPEWYFYCVLTILFFTFLLLSIFVLRNW